MTRTYQEIRAYSPIHDCDVVRVSMADERCSEFFMQVPCPDGRRGWRVKRAAALQAIGEAIDGGLEPGEVLVSPDAWAEMLAQARAEEMA